MQKSLNFTKIFTAPSKNCEENSQVNIEKNTNFVENERKFTIWRKLDLK